MLKDNTLIFKNSGILFFRLLFTSVIGLFTSRFIIQSLGASDFGLYNVVGGVVIMMAFLNTVMTSTTYRFIAFEMGRGDKRSVNKVFNLSLIIHLCMALLVLVLTETVGVYYVNNYLNVEVGKISDALFILRFSTYGTVLSIISIPYQGLVTAKENFAAQAIIEVVRSIFGLFIAIVIVYYLGNKLRLYALLIAFGSIVPSVLFFVYCKRKYSEVVKWNFQREKSSYKEMIGYTGWLMFGTAAWVGQRQGSDLIINAFFGTLLNAALGIANMVNSIVLMFARNLGQAAIPQITMSISSGNTDRTKTLVAYISKYTFFLMAFPALPILLETDFLLKLWLGAFPPYTVLFCQLMIINALIECFMAGISALILGTGKVKLFMIIGGFISLISLPIAYLLFKTGYPPYSILLIYVSATIINIFANLFLLKKIINFNVVFFLKTSHLKIIYVALLVAPLFIIRNIFPTGLLRFILFSIFAVCWLLTAIYVAGIEKKEKDMLIQLVVKQIKRKKIKYE